MRYFLLAVLFTLSVSSACQSSESFRPFTSYRAGLQGEIPADWSPRFEAEFERQAYDTDPMTVLFLSFPSIPVETLLTTLAEDFQQAPTFVNTIETDHFLWQRYEVESIENGMPIIVTGALTTTETASYVVGFQAPVDDHDSATEDILLPIIDSLQPLALSSVTEPDYFPTDGWRQSSPEAQGMDSERLAIMLDYIVDENLDIRSLVVVRHGDLVLDAHFGSYDSDDTHIVYSVTKSVMGILTGLALDEGLFDDIRAPITEFFPQYDQKSSITLESLLTMTSGLDWNEGGTAYADASNDAIQLGSTTEDWVDFILEREMVADPLTEFNYSSGNSHLLSALLQEASGETASEYAEARLFTPLGIEDFSWLSDTRQRNNGGWGLLMRTQDMAKIGFLMLHDGIWNGEQIVPSDWVAASELPQYNDFYSYQWWLDPQYFYAEGLYGQFIVVIPDMDMVVAMSSNLDESIARTIMNELLHFYILDSVRGSEAIPANPDGEAALADALAQIKE